MTTIRVPAFIARSVLCQEATSGFHTEFFAPNTANLLPEFDSVVPTRFPSECLCGACTTLDQVVPAPSFKAIRMTFPADGDRLPAYFSTGYYYVFHCDLATCRNQCIDLLVATRRLARAKWFEEYETPLPEICSHCKSVAEHSLAGCGCCRLARYCGRACQVADWQQHKAQCKKK